MTNTVPFATTFFSLCNWNIWRSCKFATWPLLFWNKKGYQLLICCYFNKIKKEIKLFSVLPWIFFQSEDTLIVAWFSCHVTSFKHSVKYRSCCILSIINFAIFSSFSKLQLNFGILSQNCDWIFSFISSPVKSCTNLHNSSICQLRLYPCSRNLTLINKFDAKLLLFHILTNTSSQFL